MTTSFPTGLDSRTRPAASDTLGTTGVFLDVVVDDAFDMIEALQAKVGINSSAVTTSHDYKLANLSTADLSDFDLTGITAGAVLYYNGTDIIDLGIGTASQVLTVNAGATAPEWATASSGSSGATVVRKSADESVTSSTTLQNDDHLLFAVAANEVWAAKFVLSIIGNGTGDFKAAVVGPAGSTVLVMPSAGLYEAFDPTSGTASQSYLNVKAGGVSANFGNSAFPSSVVLEAIIVNGATAGNLTLQWAQATSDATATTVQANSFLVANKVA